MEVMPVAEVDGIKTGSKPGVMTTTIHKAYKRKVVEYTRGFSS